jgi:hypothetical protein
MSDRAKRLGIPLEHMRWALGLTDEPPPDAEKDLHGYKLLKEMTGKGLPGLRHDPEWDKVPGWDDDPMDEGS